MTNVLRRSLLGLFLGLYVLSLCVPVTTEAPNPYYGYQLLFWGWMGAVVLQLAWFANPVFVVAALVFGMDVRSRWAVMIVAIPLFLLGAGAMLPGMTPADLSGINWGNGPSNTSLHNGPGYYLWLLVMLGLPVALVVNAFVPQRDAAEPVPAAVP